MGVSSILFLVLIHCIDSLIRFPFSLTLASADYCLVACVCQGLSDFVQEILNLMAQDKRQVWIWSMIFLYLLLIEFPNLQIYSFSAESCDQPIAM